MNNKLWSDKIMRWLWQTTTVLCCYFYSWPGLNITNNISQVRNVSVLINSDPWFLSCFTFGLTLQCTTFSRQPRHNNLHICQCIITRVSASLRKSSKNGILAKILTVHWLSGGKSTHHRNNSVWYEFQWDR